MLTTRRGSIIYQHRDWALVYQTCGWVARLRSACSCRQWRLSWSFGGQCTSKGRTIARFCIRTILQERLRHSCASLGLTAIKFDKSTNWRRGRCPSENCEKRFVKGERLPIYKAKSNLSTPPLTGPPIFFFKSSRLFWLLLLIFPPTPTPKRRPLFSAGAGATGSSGIL